MRRTDKTIEEVREYYSKVLKSSKDLKSSACCSTDSLPRAQREILKEIHPEILDRFYGCGSPIPPALDNCVVLDLGCGTGRDTYVASRLAGRGGYVYGVDMTDEQLGVGRRHLGTQMKKFGYGEPNVDFRKGYIENLGEIGIEDDSVDVVISNCVINLSPDKRSVFSEVFRVLKPGGELYFSDIFAGRRVPEYLKDDPVLYGECLGGSLYIEDFRRILREVGCLDYRIVSSRKVTINNPELERKAGMINFYSMTIRAFKLSALEDRCEDYGQVALYLGTIPVCPDKFILDDHYLLVARKPMPVCGNTALMLQETRYGKHFRIIGDMSVHFGPFVRAPLSVKNGDGSEAPGGACCG
jgi:arsenite methyltransferase